MKQLSLAETEFLSKSGKATRKAKFLAEMNAAVPWSGLEGLIEAPAGCGRLSAPQPVVSRIRFVQHLFGNSCTGVEDAQDDIPPLRQFAGLDSFGGSASGETRILTFRHFLAANHLAAVLRANAVTALSEKGSFQRHGAKAETALTVASILSQNRDSKSEAAMHSAKEGNRWHFGMKAHIGVVAESGLLGAVIGTAATVSDVTQANALLHNEESAPFGGARGNQCAKKRLETTDTARWSLFTRRRMRRLVDNGQKSMALIGYLELLKASIRAKVVYQFRVIRRQFSFEKLLCCGLAKNAAALMPAFLLSNVRTHSV